MRLTLPSVCKFVKLRKRPKPSGVIRMGKSISKTKVYYNLAGGSFLGPFAIKLRGE